MNEIKYFSPDLFFFAWYFYCENQRCRKLNLPLEYDSDDFFELLEFKDGKKYPIKAELSKMEHLLRSGIISSITFILSDDLEKQVHITKEEYLADIQSRNVPLDCKDKEKIKEMIIGKNIFQKIVYENNSEDLYYIFRVDDNCLLKFINQYQSSFRENKMQVETGNILKCSVQIEILVRQIYGLVKKHLGTGLLVEYVKGEDNYDFWATAYYLEQIGAIKVLDVGAFNMFASMKKGLGLKIDVLPKFYEDFKIKDSEEIYFDIEHLLTAEERKERIYYDGDTILKKDGVIYEMKKNTFPFILFQLLKQSSDKIIPLKAIEKAFQEAGKQIGQDTKKDLRNLRMNLKKAFSITNESKLFILKNDHISLEVGIFAF